MHDQTDIHQKLYEAITSHNPELVEQCLEHGADSNHHYGTIYPNPEMQPDTPLRLVVFCISDSMIDDDALEDFEKIASLLIDNGADVESARELAQLRYGEPEVWDGLIFGAVLEIFK